MYNQIYLAPSILSADLLKLEEQINLVIENGADFIHVDVMDGHFVPNLTFGTNIVKAIKRFVKIPIDVHLMISNPDKYIAEYAKAGADILTIHQEVSSHLHRTIQSIKENGMKAGVSINPSTSVSTLEYIISEVDLVLIMSVNPGFGGQTFIEKSIYKIQKVREMLDKANSKAFLEVDGGINLETAKLVVKAGANVLVVGNSIFGQTNIPEAVKNLKKLL
jgi:ribulose-phosphate 3-epimerase